MIPTLHANGTSRDEVDQQYENALSALRDAVTALMVAAPNARDYHPQGPDAFEKAQTQHRTRVSRVIDVRKTLKDEYERFLVATGR
jgi:hypothetical protein